MNILMIFWLFVKINFLSTSGPAQAGMVYDELVETGEISEEDYTKLLSLSSAFPGSDALQNGLLFGYKMQGILGAIVGFVGALLPPLLLVIIGLILLDQFGSVNWMKNFVNGLKPGLAVMLIMTALQQFSSKDMQKPNILVFIIIIASLSFIALYWFELPLGIVLVIAGILGVVFKI